jgi:hypothetical protein
MGAHVFREQVGRRKRSADDGSWECDETAWLATMYGQQAAELLTCCTNCLPHKHAGVGLTGPITVVNRLVLRGAVFAAMRVRGAMGHGRPGWRSFARITVIVMDAAAQHAV